MLRRRLSRRVLAGASNDFVDALVAGSDGAEWWLFGSVVRCNLSAPALFETAPTRVNVLWRLSKHGGPMQTLLNTYFSFEPMVKRSLQFL